MQSEDAGRELAEGLEADAHMQAALQQLLTSGFSSLWKHSLEEEDHNNSNISDGDTDEEKEYQEAEIVSDESDI